MIVKRILWFPLFLFCSSLLYSQEKTISGQVISKDDNSTLPGVNIVIEGTSRGVTTDLDGNYEIAVPSGNNVLIFSFTGYTTKNVTIDGKDRLDVVLEPNTELLGDVVITGFGCGSKRKKNFPIQSQA